MTTTGDPTPFDRIVTTRSAARAVEVLLEECVKDDPAACYLGYVAGRAPRDAGFKQALDDELQRLHDFLGLGT